MENDVAPWSRRSGKVVTDHRGDTFRAVYTVRYQDAVYVLHAFQKKPNRP